MKFRKTSIAFAIGYPGIVFIWEEGAASWAPTADQILILNVPFRTDIPGIASDFTADDGTPNYTEVVNYPAGIEYASTVLFDEWGWSFRRCRTAYHRSLEFAQHSGFGMMMINLYLIIL